MLRTIAKVCLAVYAGLFLVILLSMNGGPQFISKDLGVIALYSLVVFWWAVPVIVAPMCLSVDWFRIRRGS